MSCKIFRFLIQRRDSIVKQNNQLKSFFMEQEAIIRKNIEKSKIECYEFGTVNQFF
jgi:hypothetical protein